jgi:ketosteroid isomerase-like protein
MDREAVRALIEQTYQKRDAGDLDQTLAAFHPAGRIQIAGSKALTPAAVMVEGQGQLRTMLSDFIAAWAFDRREIISMVIDGDRAAVHSRVALRFVPKDKTVTTDILDLFKVQDGKIIELVEFLDTAAIGDLMR